VDFGAVLPEKLDAILCFLPFWKSLVPDFIAIARYSKQTGIRTAKTSQYPAAHTVCPISIFESLVGEHKIIYA
jgi:hypothetical protein